MCTLMHTSPKISSLPHGLPASSLQPLPCFVAMVSSHPIVVLLAGPSLIYALSLWDRHLGLLTLCLSLFPEVLFEHAKHCSFPSYMLKWCLFSESLLSVLVSTTNFFLPVPGDGLPYHRCTSYRLLAFSEAPVICSSQTVNPWNFFTSAPH